MVHRGKGMEEGQGLWLHQRRRKEWEGEEKGLVRAPSWGILLLTPDGGFETAVPACPLDGGSEEVLS